MQNSANNSYQTSSISTADRGKLIVMIYDHCLKWCRLAIQSFENSEVENGAKAIFRVQDGIVELQCSLDMEKGGEISRNLFNLYGFYNRHLTESLSQKKMENIKQVEEMLVILRKAWLDAIDKVRQEARSPIHQRSGNQIHMVG